MESAAIYIPRDRRLALALGATLPERIRGAALFADISGFTPLTEALVTSLGPRRGAEELTRQLNRVYDALIDEVDRFDGSVISFSGDAILCWFQDQDGPAALRATACALAMQAAMQPFAALALPNAGIVSLAMKATIASGSARRFVVGDPEVQLIDAIAGATIARTADAEHQAGRGEVLVDEATLSQLGSAFEVTEWRTSPETGARYACLRGLNTALSIEPPPHVDLKPLSDEQANAWVLPAIYDRLQEGLGEFLTELRHAVALFLRFEGIDYEADDTAGQKLDAFIRWAQEILTRYDGSLLALTIGDKGSYFYAAFGAPIAHEDDPRRAVSAALELRDLPDTLSFIRPVQIGISRGTMRAGAYGGMTRRTYGVLGDEVNLAARLMQRAEPGEVLISQRVLGAVGSAFDVEMLPPMQVKGKAEPVAVARVLNKHQGRATAVSYDAPLVGREMELAHLNQFLGPIFSGAFAGLAYVYGEPGIGKSRLLHEVRRRLEQERRLRWFICPAEGILRQSLNPLQYFLREYFEQSADAAEDANKARFDSLLEALMAEVRPRAPEIAQELDRTRSFLGALAGGLRWVGSLYERVEPRLRLENTLAACKVLVQGESLRQPVVLHVEDGQWLDDDTLAFIKLLTRNVGSFPFGVVLAGRYRDDGSRYTIEVDSEVPQTALDLNQLSPESVRAMAAQALHTPLSDELAAFLNEKTNGNPFFVEQLALDLRERELLTTTSLTVPGEAEPQLALTLKPNVPAAEVPVSINAVLIARLDRLAAQVKAIVQTAAVLGHEFEIWVLSQMLRDDLQVSGKVKQAEAEAIWSALSETRYLFRHILLRDAAYEMQILARLRELHALAGRAIETVYAQDLMPQAALLAYHWGAAGEGAKEARYSALAGENALRTSAFRDAARYFQRALTLLETEGAADAGVSLARLYYGLGEANAGLGGLKDAQLYLQKSLDLAQAQGDQKTTAEALSFLGGLALRLGEVEQAEARLQEGLLIARAMQDPPIIANGLLRLGNIASARGAYAEATRFYEEGLSLARTINDEMKMATALNGLGIVGLMSQALEAAQRHFEEAQTFFRAIGNRTGMLLTLGNLGTVVSKLGRPAEARHLYEQALHLSDEIGDRRLRGALLDNLGEVAYELGDDLEATWYFKESLATMLELGLAPSALLALAGVAKIRARIGQPELALELLGLALNHPACDDETRQRGEPVLAELRGGLPAESVETALARGRAQSLEALAAAILAG
jgi:class 3 adenylate cyclase/tetratricopeptide (TPR) repeat protein